MAGSLQNGIIHFNVGGRVSSTTTATLQKYPESPLFRLALHPTGKLHPIVDEKGRIFIDRDGTLFRHVLNFMRTGKLELPADFKDYDLFLQDAEYYKLPTLCDAIKDAICNLQELNKGVFIEVSEFASKMNDPVDGYSTSQMPFAVGTNNAMIIAPASCAHSYAPLKEENFQPILIDEAKSENGMETALTSMTRLQWALKLKLHGWENVGMVSLPITEEGRTVGIHLIERWYLPTAKK